MQQKFLKKIKKNIASRKKLANTCRNDWALSGQVVKAASKLVQLGVGIAKFKVISGCHFCLVFIGFIFFSIM